MKRLFSLCCLLAMLGAATAQNRAIRMPEEPLEPHQDLSEKDNGYWCSATLDGGYTSIGNYDVGMVGLEFANGYRFNQYIRVGAGVGVMYCPASGSAFSEKSHFSAPLFVNARGNVISDVTRRAVPYWSVNLGYAISDGAFFTPTFGVRVGEKRSAFLLGLSYTVRHFDTKKKSQEGYYSGVLLKLGFEF